MISRLLGGSRKQDEQLLARVETLIRTACCATVAARDGSSTPRRCAVAASVTSQAARSQAHKLPLAMQDRERKHAADRELWRRQMAEAVQQVWSWYTPAGDAMPLGSSPRRAATTTAKQHCNALCACTPGGCACMRATVCSVLLTSDTRAPVSLQLTRHGRRWRR